MTLIVTVDLIRLVIVHTLHYRPSPPLLLSTSTPPPPTRNTKPSPSPLAPANTFQHSNLPFLTTSQRCTLSASASSTLIADANFNTSTRRTANRVTGVPGGHDVGNSGRYVDGVVECPVSIVAQERRDESSDSEDVNCADAVDNVIVGFALLRRCHVKACMSSRMTEWIRRFILL